jgi:hypothetical protein
MHARLELSVDNRIDEIGKLAAGQVQYQAINSLWLAIISQLKESNAIVGQVVTADAPHEVKSIAWPPTDTL